MRSGASSHLGFRIHPTEIVEILDGVTGRRYWGRNPRLGRMDPGGELVAAALRPARTFDLACDLVLGYLAANAPMGAWVITRVVDGRQIILRTVADEDDPGVIVPGVELAFADTMCSTMVTGATPQIAPDVSQVPEYAAVAAEAPVPVGAYVGMPIVRPGGELFGTVCGYSPVRRPESLWALQPLLALLSSLLSSVLEADSTSTEAARELEQARREADTDVLTGLLNRRGWERFLELEEERYRRFGDRACVVVLDLDRLKFVNDTGGHAAGDRYIRQAGAALAGVVRADDVVARLGGDEFGVVAQGVGTEQASELLARLERALERAGVAGTFGHAPYTVVTGFTGAWKLADQAMYEQKRARPLS